jgi:hypothetical protein
MGGLQIGFLPSLTHHASFVAVDPGSMGAITWGTICIFHGPSSAGRVVANSEVMPNSKVT